LFPGGDLQNAINDTKNRCTGTCDVDGGPYKSFTFGLGGGVVGKVSDSVGLRGDLLYQQYTSMDLLKTTAGGNTVTDNLSGHRFWFLLGVEFGL
jgi:opacity protein-like surface antigen